MFMLSPGALARVSVDGIFLDVNEALAKMLGYERETLIGTSLMQLTAEPDLEKSSGYLQQIRTGKIKQYSEEKRCLCSDGSELWVEASAQAVLDEQGAPRYLILAFKNISLRRQYMDELTQRERKTQLLLETAAEGFWVCDIEGHIVEANDAYCRMIGYSREALLQMHINQLDAIEQPHITREKISHILAKGHMRFKTKHRTASGALLPLWVNVSYRAELGDYLFVFFNDVSKEDQLTARMSERNRLFLTLIDTVPDAIIFKDAGGRWLLLNQNARRLLGFTEQEQEQEQEQERPWLRQTDQQLAASRPDFRELHAALGRHDDKTWQNAETYQYRQWVKTNEVNQRFLEIRKSPIFDAEGKRQAMLIMARDITELELTEQQLAVTKRSGERLRQQASQTQSLLLIISEYTLRQIGQELHDDLGQLLSGAAMLADSLAYQAESGATVDAKLARSITSLLNETTSKTRAISHGLYPVMSDNQNLVSMIDNLIDHQRSLGGLQVTFTTSCLSLFVNGEQALHLYRILQEAFSNIRRHSGASEAEVDLQCQNSLLNIIISDNGVGIPARKRQKFNHGIGMQSMQHRAAHIGAQFAISNKHRGGTSITIFMPLTN